MSTEPRSAATPGTVGSFGPLTHRVAGPVGVVHEDWESRWPASGCRVAPGTVCIGHRPQLPTAGLPVLDVTEQDGNAAYVAKADIDKIKLGAADLEVTQGAPTLGTRHYWPVWLLDSATSEMVGSVVRTPADWATVDIVLWWVNVGTGTGDVNFRALTRSQGVGEALASPAGTAVVATAGAQDVITTTPLVTGVAVADTKYLLVDIQRQGPDATDTLGNDIGLIAVTVKKAS